MTVRVRLDRDAPGPCVGEGMICAGDATYLAVLGNEYRQKVALLGLCSWCVSNQGRYIRAALMGEGWDGLGLVDLRDDVQVRALERNLAEMSDEGWILGDMPSAS